MYNAETVGNRGSMVTMARSEALEKCTCVLYHALKKKRGELRFSSFSGPCRVRSYVIGFIFPSGFMCACALEMHL